jgi:DNA-binding LacI/PurR family transcriptional regulator
MRSAGGCCAVSDTSLKRRRPTSYDVARLAGVSQSAVSRAFNPDATASAEMREKVRLAAATLGYRPNALARAVNRQSSKVVGLVLSTETARHFPDVTLALTRSLGDRGFATMLFTPSDRAEALSVVEHILNYRNDGVIAAGLMPDEAVRLLEAADVPVILYNRTSATPACSVSCDHFGSGAMIGRRLVELGHRHIAVIDGPEESSVARERAAGVVHGIGDAGWCRIIRKVGDYSYASGARAMRELGDVAVTAVVAISDTMALGAHDVAVGPLGLDVPRDLSIVGFDGIASAEWLHYRLTTVAQPVARMAHAAVELLEGRILGAGDMGCSRIISGEWLAGATLGPAPCRQRPTLGLSHG